MFKKQQNNRFAGPMNQYPHGMQMNQAPEMNYGSTGNYGSAGNYGPTQMPGGMFQSGPMGQQGPMGPQGPMPQGGAMFPQVQEDRLQFEIRENRRRITNLTKRVIRLENYLRIRDSSDYVNIDDDQIPHEFSM